MKFRFLILLCLLFLFFNLPKANAETAGDVDSKITQLQQKISELQGQENSLSRQINLLNSQIALTTLRVDGTRSAIDKLTSEINDLVDEIEKLEVLLNRRSELVLRRIPESYKRQVTPNFGIIFFSQNFSDLLARIKYLESVQEDDAKLLFQLKATQNNFAERKALREQKKTEQEKLKRQLENESRELARQKKEKQVLLTETRSSEAVYQSLLAQALAEKQALDRAIIEGVKIGTVSKGDPIALVGNTGWPACSTGDHLHFEVRKNNSWVDPASYLSSKTIYDEQTQSNWTVGAGNWDWPLQDPIRLTQRFGHTPWSYRYNYSGGIHTGFDMLSSNNKVIRAPSGGTLFSSSQSCGSTSIIKIKYIEHGDGIVSFYLHVQ